MFCVNPVRGVSPSAIYFASGLRYALGEWALLGLMPLTGSTLYMNKLNLTNTSVRIAIIVGMLLLVGALGFAIGYLARGNATPAPIIIEKCAQ